MPTRQQLARRKILLDGLVVDKWFKKRCDGCSVPTWTLGKLALKKMVRAACDIHDFEYTVIPILYPLASRDAKKLRKESDKRLRRNCKTILASMGRYPIRGRILGPVYYYSVRMGGKVAIKPVSKKMDRMPRNPREMGRFVEMINEAYTMTDYGRAELETLRRRLGL